MVEIKDVGKLRPELLDMSRAELERRLAEIEMAIQEKKQEERRKEVDGLVVKVNAAQQAMVDNATFLNEYGFLPETVKAAYTGTGGTFAPHLKHKPVDADRMIARLAAMEGDPKPKRTRRKKAA